MIQVASLGYGVIFKKAKDIGSDTSEPYGEWLRAIDDSLDEEVDENDYQRQEIKEIFNSIQKDLTTPQEYARMKDEYSEALLRQNEYDNGRKAERLQNAKKMLAEGLDISLIAKITGLSVEELQKL